LWKQSRTSGGLESSFITQVSHTHHTYLATPADPCQETRLIIRTPLGVVQGNGPVIIVETLIPSNLFRTILVSHTGSHEVPDGMVTERTGRSNVRWVSQLLSLYTGTLLSPITLRYSPLQLLFRSTYQTHRIKRAGKGLEDGLGEERDRRGKC